MVHNIIKTLLLLSEPVLKSCDITLSLQGYIHLYDITSAISKVLTSNKNLLAKYKPTLEEKVSHSATGDAVNLRLYGMEKLRHVVEECLSRTNDLRATYTSLQENVIKAYIKMAYFAQKGGASFEELCICSILRAMKLGSVDGIQLFPCVLSMQNLGTVHKELFILEVLIIDIMMASL